MSPRVSLSLTRFFALLSVLAVQSMVTNIAASGQVLRPSFRIAFVLHGNIWLVDAATSHRTRLTSDGHDSAPTWTAGGTALLFQRQAGNRIETMRWQQGRGITRVRDGLWSPDGTAVTFTRALAGNGPATTVWVARQGRLARITPPEHGFRWSPLAWSPDGSRLALGRFTLLRGANSQAAPYGPASLWLAGTSTATPSLRRLPLPPASPGQPGWPDAVVWSPDGRYLAVGVGPDQACVSCRADGEPYSVLPVSGGAAVRLGVALHPDGALSWATSGSYIVLSVPGGRETYANKHLTAVDPVTGARRGLARDPSYADVEPAVSPDGTRVAFARGRAQGAGHWLPVPLIASRHVYLVDANDARAHARRLAGAPGWTDESPVWSPDGQWIVFVRWRRRMHTPAAAQLWAVRPNGADARKLTGLDLPAQFLNGFGYYGSFGWKGLFVVAP